MKRCDLLGSDFAAGVWHCARAGAPWVGKNPDDFATSPSARSAPRSAERAVALAPATPVLPVLLGTTSPVPLLWSWGTCGSPIARCSTDQTDAIRASACMLALCSLTCFGTCVLLSSWMLRNMSLSAARNSNLECTGNWALLTARSSCPVAEDRAGGQLLHC